MTGLHITLAVSASAALFAAGALLGVLLCSAREDIRTAVDVDAIMLADECEQLTVLVGDLQAALAEQTERADAWHACYLELDDQYGVDLAARGPLGDLEPARIAQQLAHELSAPARLAAAMHTVIDRGARPVRTTHAPRKRRPARAAVAA